MSIFTKKHYEKIAKLIQEMVLENEYDRKYVVGNFVCLFKEDNSILFNEEKFIKACSK